MVTKYGMLWSLKIAYKSLDPFELSFKSDKSGVGVDTGDSDEVIDLTEWNSIMLWESVGINMDGRLVATVRPRVLYMMARVQ